MKTPKVSVLIPTFRPDQAHLTAALERLQNQSAGDFNAVIIDDASEEDTRKIVEPFLKDARFSYRRNPARLGIGGNWNACLEHATAPALQFLFQDDLWGPTFLERGLAVLDEHPSVGLLSLDHEYAIEHGDATFYEELTAFKRSSIKEGLHRGFSFLREWLNVDLRPGLMGEPSFVMLRTALAAAVGPFRTDLPQCLDNEYWTRCLLRADWYYVKEPHGTFRVHAKGASAQNSAGGEGVADRLRIYTLLLPILPDSNLKREGGKSLERALASMVRKFFRQKTTGTSQRIHPREKRMVLTFMLMHPIITLRAILAVILPGRSHQ